MTANSRFKGKHIIMSSVLGECALILKCQTGHACIVTFLIVARADAGRGIDVHLRQIATRLRVYGRRTFAIGRTFAHVGMHSMVLPRDYDPIGMPIKAPLEAVAIAPHHARCAVNALNKFQKQNWVFETPLDIRTLPHENPMSRSNISA